MSRDIARECHVTLRVTLPIWVSIHVKLLIFFASTFIQSKELNKITTNSVTFTRDLARGCHVTLTVILPILVSIHAKLYTVVTIVC